MLSLLLSLHIFATIIWVGGMFFAHLVLRPSAIETLEAPLRLTLWHQVFKRFFFWVWLSVITLVVTGYMIIFMYFGGFAGVGIHVHIMQLSGLLMMVIYAYLYFATYQKFKNAVIIENWPQAGQQLFKIRNIVTVNLILGLLTSMVAVVGRYF
ncbi:MAG: CopD family protein [Gammaproteobacteria bacterium]